MLWYRPTPVQATVFALPQLSIRHGATRSSRQIPHWKHTIHNIHPVSGARFVSCLSNWYLHHCGTATPKSIRRRMALLVCFERLCWYFQFLTYTRVDLAICSVNFGSVAIWCTHFIGNRAIVLGDGERKIQLYYDTTYFVLSATLPVFPILTGFLTAAKCHEIRRGAFVQFGSLAVCGLCTGGAATMLHYLVNNSITNYIILFSLWNILSAAAMAIVTCAVGFGLFFYWS